VIGADCVNLVHVIRSVLNSAARSIVGPGGSGMAYVVGKAFGAEAQTDLLMRLDLD
jgi:hypothetical protein